MAPPRVSIPRVRLDSIRLKARPDGPLLVPTGPGQPIWTPRRYDRLADEGFIINAIVYRCVSLIADGIASLVLEVRRDRTALDSHPLYTLLARPNPLQPGAQFMHAITAFELIAGQSYIHATRPSPSRPPLELWALRPDRVKIVPAENGMPMGFEYEANGRKIVFPVDPITGQGEVLHLKTFHPLDDWYGLSPIEPAARSIDQDNAAGAHNAALLQNQARPSGAFIHQGALDADKRKAAEEVLRSWYTGSNKAGLPVVLGGGWTFTEMNITPKDLDFYEGMQHHARRICAAFNVPHVLVVPGESTYSNRREAREELYENCVLPRADKLMDALNGWLAPMFGPGIEIAYDPDQIPALANKREIIRAGARSDWRDGLIKHGEAREALGYMPDPAAAELYRHDIMQAMIPASIDQPGAGDEARDDEDKGNALDGLASIKAAKPATEHGGRVKALGDDILGALDDGDMIDLMLPAIRDTVFSFGQAELDRLGIGIRFDLFDSKVADFLREWGAERVTGYVTRTTKRQIGATIAEAIEGGETQFQMVKRIQKVFDQATGVRARTIAQTETVRASNFGALEAIVQSGLAHKQWLSTRDERTRGNKPEDTADHKGLDLVIVPVTDDFVDPRNGHRFQHPGASPHAEDVVNCRCVVSAYDVEEEDEQRADVAAMETKAAMIWKQRDAQRLPFAQHLEALAIQGFYGQLERVMRVLRRTAEPTA